MKDGLGKDLKLGQLVAIPCNSIFKVGVLYNYKANNSKHYRRLCDNVEGRIPYEDNDWRRRYYTREKMEAQANCYYIRFPDGKRRTMTNKKSILGLPEGTELEG